MFEDSASALPSFSSSIWESMNSWFTPTVFFILLNLVIGTIAFTSTLSNQKRHHNQQQVNDTNQAKIARSTSVLQRLKSVNFYASYRSHQESPQNGIFNHKQSTDSESLFHFEHAHQEQTSEAQSHYFFPPTHQDNFKENFEAGANDSQERYSFEKTHKEIPPVMKSHPESGENEVRFDDFHELGGEPVQSMDEVYSQLTGNNNFSRTKSDTEPSSGVTREKLPTRINKSASLKSTFGRFEAEEMVETRRPATVREQGIAKLADDDEEVDAKADDFINRFKQQLKLQRIDSIVKYKEVTARGSAGT